jgi:hypothetical protein
MVASCEVSSLKLMFQLRFKKETRLVPPVKSFHVMFGEGPRTIVRYPLVGNCYAVVSAFGNRASGNCPMAIATVNWPKHMCASVLCPSKREYSCRHANNPH